MSLLTKLPLLVEEGRVEYQRLIQIEPGGFHGSESFGQEENYLVWADNLSYMRRLLLTEKRQKSFQLIYIDPPFFSKADYRNSVEVGSNDSSTALALSKRIKQKAYGDIWEDGMEGYLRMLTVRLLFMKELLCETGCLWIHLDWHAVHYVKIILDEIFGSNNLVNEVIWYYKSGGVSKRRFARKHDTLLFYSSTDQYYFQPQQEKSYNRGYKPYRFKGVKEYEDEIGWHTLVNMKDVWQIDMVGRTSAERTGYATQKPEALLARILQSCTREGDLCGDFFCGSGTLAAVAHSMNRRWMICDQGKLAVADARKRLALHGASFQIWYERKRQEEALKEEEGGLLQVRGSVSEDGEGLVELLSYTPTANTLVTAKKLIGDGLERHLVERPLFLIDCWSVDPHFDRKVFRPVATFVRQRGSLEICWQGSCSHTVAIKGVDIFGNEAITLL